MVEALGLEVVPENPGQLPSEEPLAAQVDTVSWPFTIPESMSGAWLGVRKQRVCVAGYHIDHHHQSRRAVAHREHDSIEHLPYGHSHLRPMAPKGHREVSDVRPI